MAATTGTGFSEQEQLERYIMKALELSIDETVTRVTNKYKALAHKEISQEINKEKVKIALAISTMYDVQFDVGRVIINMKIHNENDQRMT